MAVKMAANHHHPHHGIEFSELQRVASTPTMMSTPTRLARIGSGCGIPAVSSWGQFPVGPGFSLDTGSLGGGSGAPGGGSVPGRKWQIFEARDSPLPGFAPCGEQDAPEDAPAPPTLPDPANVAVPGYEGAAWKPGLLQCESSANVRQLEFILPPSQCATSTEEESPPEETYISAGKLSEEDVRNALLDHVHDQGCCYGTSAAKGMTLSGVQPSSAALHYRLETFTESRTTGYNAEPYSGQLIDGPDNGTPPSPWEIQCQPNTLFANECCKMVVPHTSFLVPCSNCDQLGHVTCLSCHGWGNRRCLSCHGAGSTDFNGNSRPCTWCQGGGRRRCSMCYGYGRTACLLCQGYCWLRSYIELTVNYSNHVEDFVDEHTDLPSDLVKDVEGQIVLSNASKTVRALEKHPAPVINQTSASMVARHARQWPTERIIRQKQTLRSIPVYQVECAYKGRRSKFWVYGDENKVYFPDYPQQNLWGCTIS